MALFKEKLHCPVCKTYLGDRFKDEVFYAHCDECKVMFTWKYKEHKPVAHLDGKTPVKCGCGGCGR